MQTGVLYCNGSFLLIKPQMLRSQPFIYSIFIQSLYGIFFFNTIFIADMEYLAYYN